MVFYFNSHRYLFFPAGGDTQVCRFKRFWQIKVVLAWLLQYTCFLLSVAEEILGQDFSEQPCTAHFYRSVAESLEKGPLSPRPGHRNQTTGLLESISMLVRTGKSHLSFNRRPRNHCLLEAFEFLACKLRQQVIPSVLNCNIETHL